MEKKAILVGKVAERLSEIGLNESNEQKINKLFSPKVLKAMRLAELFEDIQPETYILPSRVMAGFPVKVVNKDCS